MTDENEQSIPSLGSQPDAWAVAWKGDTKIDRSTVCCTEDAARRRADECPALNGVAVPLYRATQPTLTDEEREAIDRLCRAVARHTALQRIRGLKDRFADEDEQAYSSVREWLARLT